MADYENHLRIQVALEQWAKHGQLLADFADKSGGPEHRKPLEQLKAAVTDAAGAIEQLQQTRRKRG